MENQTNPFLKTVEVIKERNKEILTYLSNGLTSAEIGKLVFLSPRTIEQRILAMRNQTGSKNIPHLVAQAIRHGIIQ